MTRPFQVPFAILNGIYCAVQGCSLLASSCEMNNRIRAPRWQQYMWHFLSVQCLDEEKKFSFSFDSKTAVLVCKFYFLERPLGESSYPE